jgi:methyl-accepting chemotaxis protein
LRVKYKSAVLQDLITKNVGTATDASVLLLDPLHIRMADSRNPGLIQKSIVPLEPIDYLLAVDSRRFLNIPREEQATNYQEFELALDNVEREPFFRADITPNTSGDDTIAAAFLQTQPWIVTYSRPTSNFLADAQKQVRVNIIVVIIVSIFIFIATAFSASSLTTPITALAKIADLIAQGDLSARAQIQSRDEIGTLAGSFNLMTSQLQETLNNLEQRVTERSAVAESARAESESARAESELARIDLEAQVWLATGQTQLADAMRGEYDLHHLADNIISQLCRYIGVQAGALFLLNEKTLTLAGRYAFSERPGFNDKFQLGEGFVGQAAMDGEVFYLEDIPSDALVISTGLVEVKPRQMIAAPFFANGQVVGVLELATLSAFKQHHFELLQRVSEGIGIAFRTTQTRQRLADLLMESQQQAEELLAQEEELRAANEELHAQAENFRTDRDLRAQK